MIPDARRVPERHERVLNSMSNTFWVLILAIIALFAFFVALGAFSPGEVAGLTLAVIGLTVLWVAHAMWDSRHRDGRDPATVRARERRGF
jgi:fatty acid desaturase